jgi:hypothetical protein
MSGLSLKVGGFGGVGTTDDPSFGTAQSYNSVTQAAFGPGVTVPTSDANSALSPAGGVGLAFWTGVASIVLLVVIRSTLPK